MTCHVKNDMKGLTSYEELVTDAEKLAREKSQRLWVVLQEIAKVKIILKCTCSPKCMHYQEFGKVKQKYGRKENRNKEFVIKINMVKFLLLGCKNIGRTYGKRHT